MEMISNRPYLLRAFYDWIVDSNCTPVLVADPHHPKCKIPSDHTNDNEVVFNVSPTAVRDLDISNELVQFRASFNGIVHLITIPINAIFALYADENNEGLYFDGTEEDSISDSANAINTTLPFSVLSNKPFQEEALQIAATDAPPKGKPILRIVE